MTKAVPDINIIGKELTGIYESKNQITQPGIPGPASFFKIVIELNSTEHYELGAHEIYEWDYKDDLVLMKNSFWAQKNNILTIGQSIKKLLRKDYFETDGNTLVILLDNNAFIEHQIDNGDDLFIGNFESDYE